MGINVVQKGKRAERAVASALNVVLERVVANIQMPAYSLRIDPLILKRNLSQTQAGGFDLEGLPWIAIEVKHHKTVCLPAWWRQTCFQAGTDEGGGPIVGRNVREPVLVWKQNGGKWNVRMIGRLEIEPGRRLRVVVDVSWEAFLQWFERRAEVELRKTLEDEDFSCPEPSLFG